MDMVKKFFPFSFGKVGAKDVNALVVSIIIYLVAGAVLGLVLGLLSHVWLIGFVFGIAGGIVELYCVAGIVLSVLLYLDALK